MTQSQRQATDSMIHRIAQAKKEYGADRFYGKKHLDSYVKASDRIKKERS